jgi:hypothetical protein
MPRAVTPQHRLRFGRHSPSSGRHRSHPPGLRKRSATRSNSYSPNMPTMTKTCMKPGAHDLVRRSPVEDAVNCAYSTIRAGITEMKDQWSSAFRCP